MLVITFSIQVGSMPGIPLVLDASTDTALAFSGSGEICSAVTNKRCKAVPSGVQVINVITGLPAVS